MIELLNEQELPINEILISSVAQKMLEELGFADFSVCILLTDNLIIAELNAQFRQKNQPTDILTFPAVQDAKDLSEDEKSAMEDKALGDIAISIERVLVDAQELGISLDARIYKLLAHGLSHILGHDHYTPEADALMRPLEEKLLLAVSAPEGAFREFEDH